MIRTVLVLVVTAALLGAAGFLLLARDIYVVESGSMSPTLRVGDAVVVKSLDGPAHPGQVITFEVQGKLITHRVTRVEGDGIHVKGDALEEEDPWTIPPAAVRGEMDFRIPYAGYLIVFLRQPMGWLSLVVLPALLLFATEVRKAVRHPRRARAAPAAAGAAHKPEPRSGEQSQALAKRAALVAALLAGLAMLAALALALHQGSVFSSFSGTKDESPAIDMKRRGVRRHPRAAAAPGAAGAARSPRPRPGECPPATVRLAALVAALLAGLAMLAALAAALHGGSVFGFFSGTRDESLVITTEAFEPIPATTVDIDPDVLNLKSQGRWVTAYIELPQGYNVGNIDISTVRLCLDEVTACPEDESIPAAEHPTAVGDHDGDTVPDRMMKFDRQALIDLLAGQTGDVTMSVTGTVTPPGESFAGSDTIRVIDDGCGGRVDEALCEGEDSREATPSPEPTPTPEATPLPEATAPPLAPAPDRPPPEPAPAGPTFEYQVQPGDTLFDIALRFGTSVQVLMQLNGLSSAQVVWIGQVLGVPGTAPAPASAPPPPPPPDIPTVEYAVRPGERVADVAAFFGTTVDVVVALNGLTNPNLIVPGQRLLVPEPPAAASAPGPAFTSEYVVQPGENLTDIAARFGTTVEALAAANSLANPSAIRIGDRLLVP